MNYNIQMVLENKAKPRVGQFYKRMNAVQINEHLTFFL